MTLAAVEPARLTWPGDHWPAYEIAPVCQHPDCAETWWLEGHHVIRRSNIGRAEFVAIDGQVIANRVALCKVHHDQITGMVGGHQAAIVYPPADGLTAGLYRAWWVWYAAGARAAAAAAELPDLPLKSGGVLKPLDFLKGVVLL